MYLGLRSLYDSCQLRLPAGASKLRTGPKQTSHSMQTGGFLRQIHAFLILAGKIFNYIPAVVCLSLQPELCVDGCERSLSQPPSATACRSFKDEDWPLAVQENGPAQYVKLSQPSQTAPSTPDTREAKNRRSETAECLTSAQYEPPWMRTELGTPPASRRDRLPIPKEPLPSVNIFSLIKNWIGAAP